MSSVENRSGGSAGKRGRNRSCEMAGVKGLMPVRTIGLISAQEGGEKHRVRSHWLWLRGLPPGNALSVSGDTNILPATSSKEDQSTSLCP